MSDRKDSESPATTSFAWDIMQPKWDRIETLLGGTEAMRQKGEQYLPRHNQEELVSYNERLDSTTLFNMFELTLDSLVGRPFSDPVKINDDVPQEIRDILKDVDFQGNDLSVFARKWFSDGVAKAFSHVLVDFPSIDDEERDIRTREDDLNDGLRPYFNLISPENVIFASSEIVNSVEVLTHVRIFEQVTEMEGFAEVIKERIRVLEPGSFILYEKQKNKKKEEWVIIDEGITDLPFIPLVTFYANEKEDLMIAKPPLEDLAHLNIRHWQSTSDQISVLTVARFPMLAVAGATDTTGSTMAIGPKQLLGTKDPNGRFYYVEHTGRAIEAGRQDLLDIEEMMSSYGAEFLKRRPGNATATARALDSAEATSPLQDMTVRFIDALNTAISYLGAWLNIEDAGTIEITTDFGPERLNEAHVRALLELRRNRDLSINQVLLELQRLGGLSDEFDVEENIKELLSEPSIQSPFATGNNVRKINETQGRPPSDSE